MALKQGYESYCQWMEDIKDLHFHTPIMQAALSNYFINTGRFQSALDAANSAKEQSLDNTSYAEALNLLSVIYFYQGNIESSSAAAKEALSLKDLEKRLYVNLYRNLATSELMSGKTQEAMEAIKKAVEISIEAKNIPLELSTLIRYGICQAHGQQFDQALATYDQCLQLDSMSYKNPEAYQPSIKILALKELCMERQRRQTLGKPPYPEGLITSLNQALELESMPIFKVLVLVNLYRLYTFYEKIDKALSVKEAIEKLKEGELKELGERVYTPPLFGWDLLPL